MAQDIMHKDILLIDLHLGIIINCLPYCRASQKKTQLMLVLAKTEKCKLHSYFHTFLFLLWEPHHFHLLSFLPFPAVSSGFLHGPIHAGFHLTKKIQEKCFHNHTHLQRLSVSQPWSKRWFSQQLTMHFFLASHENLLCYPNNIPYLIIFLILVTC